MRYNICKKGKRVKFIMEERISNTAERLRMLMEQFGLTQADFGKTVGIDRSTVSLYLNGKRVPRQDKLALISEKYRVQPGWLMGYDMPMRKETSIIRQDIRVNDTLIELDRVIDRMSDEKRAELLQYANFLLARDKN